MTPTVDLPSSGGLEVLGHHLVSDADREAERAIRDLLSLERPGDGLVAE